jgi:hypothetical protein
MPNHLKVLALATMLVVSGRAFALEDSYLPTGNIPYATEAPDQPQRLGPLWGERAKGPAGTLLKVPGNWRAGSRAHCRLPRSGHPGPVGALADGWRRATKVELPPGSYWTQKANEMHDDACLSNTECVILLINDTPYETYLPK